MGFIFSILLFRLEIEDAFSKIGPIKNIWVAKNPPSFAYVEMEDPRYIFKQRISYEAWELNE